MNKIKAWRLIYGLFDIFKKKSKDENEFAEDSTNDFVCDMNEHISEKCEYGDAMENLNEYERVFYVTQQLEMEVNNGGFSQFFYNSSGDFSGELVYAFNQIGAYKTAEICKKALEAFGREVPADREEREELMDRMESEEFDEILSQCDDDFYEYEDDLNALNYAYIMKYHNYFN